MVTVVAPRTDETDLSILPSPMSLRAFLLEGPSGALLRKGVFGFPSIGFRFNRLAPILLCLPRPKRKGSRFGIRFEVVDPGKIRPGVV